MPYNITKLKDGGYLNEFEGIVTLEDNRAVYINIFGRDEFGTNSIPYVISDWSKVKSISHSNEGVRSLAKLTAERLRAFPETLFAVVVPGDLLFALGQKWKAHLGEEKRANLFRTREEAVAWIRLNLPKR